MQQETRLFDPARGETRSLRSKEDAHDYRYFPDPDLLPLVLEESWVAALKAGLPELPDAKRARFVAEHGLSPYDAGVLVADQETAAFYETVAHGRDAKQAANWMMGDFFAALNRTGRTIGDSPVSARSLGELIDLIGDRTINGRIAKEVFEAMVESGEPPGAIVEARGLRQVVDTGAIDAAVDAVLAANPDKLAEYRGRQGEAVRVLRGPGDEGDGGEGEPGAGERGDQGEAGVGGGGPRLCLGPGPSPRPSPAGGSGSRPQPLSWAIRRLL